MTRLRWAVGILWPSFIVACAMEMLVFGLIDPVCPSCGTEMTSLSRQGVYTLAFFVLWLMAAASSACTMLLVAPPVSDETEPASAASP